MDNAEQRRFQIFYWRILKHIVLLSIEDDGCVFCWIFFSIVLRHWMPLSQSSSVIQSAAYDREDLLRLETLAHDVCRFESTRKELIFKLQGVAIAAHSQSSLINSFRFMGFRVWCNSFIIYIFFRVLFFSIVLACLSLVCRVSSFTSGNATRTHEYLFGLWTRNDLTKNATGTCVRFFSLSCSVEKIYQFTSNSFDFGQNGRKPEMHNACARSAIIKIWKEKEKC